MLEFPHFYRGVACNPWAILDRNLDKVGCSILYLDRKIDGGKIIFYSKPRTNKKIYLIYQCML